MKIGYLMQEGAPDVRARPLAGAANHVWQVFKELHRLGHDMRLVVRYDGRAWRSDDLEAFEPVGPGSIDLGWRRLLERAARGAQSRLRLPYLGLFESIRFSQACCRELAGCDLLYERMGWMGYGGGLAAQRLGVPLVLEANNGDFITELERRGLAPTGLQRRLAVAAMRRAIRRASHVAATGQGHRQRFIDWWRVSPERVSVVENGSEVVALLSREQLRAFQPVRSPASGVTVVFVGAFEPWHGILKLIPAMAKVVADVPSARLVLIGSGPEKEKIVGLIRECGLDSRVEMPGQLEIREVAKRLSEADIGVAPYCGWMEYSGLKVFDYKSAGLAIVASGESGQPVTLKHGDTALIVPPCDVDALADGIRRLALDPEMRQRLGRTARIEAERLHSWQSTALQLEGIFTTLTGGNLRGRRGTRV